MDPLPVEVLLPLSTRSTLELLYLEWFSHQLPDSEIEAWPLFSLTWFIDLRLDSFQLVAVALLFVPVAAQDPSWEMEATTVNSVSSLP